jgi:hypothetical protein
MKKMLLCTPSIDINLNYMHQQSASQMTPLSLTLKDSDNGHNCDLTVDIGHYLRLKYLWGFKGLFCLHLQINVERGEKAILNPGIKISSF